MKSGLKKSLAIALSIPSTVIGFALLMRELKDKSVFTADNIMVLIVVLAFMLVLLVVIYGIKK